MIPNLRILVTGPLSSAGSYGDAFRRLGHEVADVDVDRYYRVGVLNYFVNRLLRPIAPTPDYWGTQTYNEKILDTAKAFSPDFIFFCHPRFVRPQTLVALKQAARAALYSFFPGDAFTPRLASRYFYDSIPLYDCHFTTESRLVAQFLANGARKAEHLPRAVTLRRAKEDAIGVARSLDEALEIAATGRFLLIERSPEAAETFREGIEAEFFTGSAELRRKLDYFSAHPSERAAIAEKGYERAKRPDLSYDARATTVLTFHLLKLHGLQIKEAY